MKSVGTGVLATLLALLTIGVGLLGIYGLFDLAKKEEFVFFAAAIVFPPYAFVQGLGAFAGGEIGSDVVGWCLVSRDLSRDGRVNVVSRPRAELRA